MCNEESKCPECGSDEIRHCHADETQPPAYTETDWWYCDDCGHEWGFE